MNTKEYTHKLTIEPGIEPKHRHKIEDLLEELGYDVYGGGQDTNKSSCDITFSKYKDKKSQE